MCCQRGLSDAAGAILALTNNSVSHWARPDATLPTTPPPFHSQQLHSLEVVLNGGFSKSRVLLESLTSQYGFEKREQSQAQLECRSLTWARAVPTESEAEGKRWRTVHAPPQHLTFRLHPNAWPSHLRPSPGPRPTRLLQITDYFRLPSYPATPCRSTWPY